MKKLLCIVAVFAMIGLSASGKLRALEFSADAECVSVCACETDELRQIAKVCLTLDVEFDLDDLDDVRAFADATNVGCSCHGMKSVLWVLATEHHELYLETFTDIQRRTITEYMKTCCHCGEAKSVHEHFGGTHENGGHCIGCGDHYQQHILTFVSTGNTFHHVECSCGWCAEPTTHRFDQEHTYERDGDLRHLVCIDCGQDCWWDCSGWTCER